MTCAPSELKVDGGSGRLSGTDTPCPTLITRLAGLMTEGQILFDAINVCWIHHSDFFHAPAAFRIFGAHQVAAASAPDQDFAGAGDLETLGY